MPGMSSNSDWQVMESLLIIRELLQDQGKWNCITAGQLSGLTSMKGKAQQVLNRTDLIRPFAIWYSDFSNYKAGLRKGLISETGDKKKAIFVLLDFYKTKKAEYYKK